MKKSHSYLTKKDMDQPRSLLEQFAAPSKRYRPWPFLALNDEYPEGSGERRITEILENMARVGYGGVFLHARPGLITEYLSDRWFEVIRHCIAECRRLGIVSGLYDENSYPSGFAGGHVPAMSPQTAIKYVTPKFGQLPALPPQDALAIYRVEGGVPIQKMKIEELTQGSEWCAFVMERMEPLAWHGDFAYTSLLDPQTTKTFLETTHDRYRSELSDEDWSLCAAMFTDEPHLASDSHASYGRGQQFSPLVQGYWSRSTRESFTTFPSGSAPGNHRIRHCNTCITNATNKMWPTCSTLIYASILTPSTIRIFARYSTKGWEMA